MEHPCWVLRQIKTTNFTGQDNCIFGWGWGLDIKYQVYIGKVKLYVQIEANAQSCFMSNSKGWTSLDKHSSSGHCFKFQNINLVNTPWPDTPIILGQYTKLKCWKNVPFPNLKPPPSPTQMFLNNPNWTLIKGEIEPWGKRGNKHYHALLCLYKTLKLKFYWTYHCSAFIKLKLENFIKLTIALPLKNLKTLSNLPLLCLYAVRPVPVTRRCSCVWDKLKEWSIVLWFDNLKIGIGERIIISSR